MHRVHLVAWPKMIGTVWRGVFIYVMGCQQLDLPIEMWCFYFVGSDSVLPGTIANNNKKQLGVRNGSKRACDRKCSSHSCH